MIEETFTDQERLRVRDLAIAALPKDRADAELLTIISRLTGTDTRLVAQRAYPSRDLANRLTEIIAIPDEAIDFSDIPECPEDWFQRAKLRRQL